MYLLNAIVEDPETTILAGDGRTICCAAEPVRDPVSNKNVSICSRCYAAVVGGNTLTHQVH